MDAKQILAWFNMQANTAEGGYYESTYTSSVTVDKKCLQGFPSSSNQRPICSAIYYFIDADGFSAMHRVSSDMLYHFYSGDPVQMLLLYPPGSANKTQVNYFTNDLSAGGQPMIVIPGGTWIGSRLVAGGQYALMGVSMAPAFDPSDYEIGNRNQLIREYPEQAALIGELTRSTGVVKTPRALARNGSAQR
ncbi:MAG TPA: cupin domain-containing protein [Puia sp.]|jgi:predicted cupin superfamily sugar epimerase|nr:cupin domain-containing protein [Puia sp.]